MTRNIGFVILSIVLGLLTILMLSEHRAQSMVLVQASAPTAARIFAPCPIAPRNFPIPKESRA